MHSTYITMFNRTCIKLQTISGKCQQDSERTITGLRRSSPTELLKQTSGADGRVTIKELTEMSLTVYFHTLFIVPSTIPKRDFATASGGLGRWWWICVVFDLSPVRPHSHACWSCMFWLSKSSPVIHGSSTLWGGPVICLDWPSSQL